jgi:hypothetical protein
MWLCTWLTFQTSVKGATEQNISFESFLQNPPVIRHAAFDVIVGNDTDLTKPHDVSTTFILDGTNFLMSEVPVGAELMHKNGLYFCGELNGVRWHGGGWGNDGILMMFDPSINTNSSNPQDPMYWSETSVKAIEDNREKINLMMCLGIQKMVVGSIVWQAGATNFSASFHGMGNDMTVARRAGGTPITNYLADTGTLLVQVAYDHGVPANAIVELAGRSEFWGYLIKYRYTSDFFNGRLPSEWTVYSHFNGNVEERYSVKVRELELADESLPLGILDPRQTLAAQWKEKSISSNNVDYWVNGINMTPVLTAASAQALQVKKNIDANPPALIHARVQILCVFLVPPLLYLLYLRRRKT